MAGLYSRYFRLIDSLGDIAFIALSTIIAESLVADQGSANTTFTEKAGFLGLGIAAWFICNTLSGAYKFNRVTSVANVLTNTLKVLLLYVLLVEAILSIFKIALYAREFLLIHYVLLIICIFTWRVFLVKILRYYRKRGYNNRRVIIVGVSETGMLLKNIFQQHPEYGYHFKGIFDDNQTAHPDVRGRIAELEQFVIEQGINEIYCSPSAIKTDQLKQLINFVDNNLVRIKLISDLGEHHYKKLKIDFYDMLPVLILRSIPLDDVLNKTLKRTFDILFSLIVIVFILSWLLPILAIIIKLDSKGPVFFKQVRSGIDNKNFQCYKLRSMYMNTDANRLLARRGDSRITPVGAFIRKTSLDELPQFFNVLLGHMSIVGPRPHMLKLGEEYAQVAEKYMVRHFIKPGITGLSQVRGYRGDTTQLYQIRGRVKLDIFYLENWSFLLDLKIIFYTVYNMFRGDKAAF
ncbi:undecaprenyl-phosphate glucose phosphotransferase [Pontibacter liquoris]|uniref:undecaprenyl-phosphate glucose phosphotransferase n=1 Tax=Pontibacter liquoris TaxID=2905677 RepID=UPI001FA7142E|nr:undecaprenyl-phosphate glucose phosphotransferase [Pontibacter liquoris]